MFALYWLNVTQKFKEYVSKHKRKKLLGSRHKAEISRFNGFQIHHFLGKWPVTSAL